MKRIISLALCILMLLSTFSMFSVVSFAEGQTIIIKPSRFGAWENWINSPNLKGDYDSTTQLLIEVTDADGNAITLPANAQWELTISAGSTTKTIHMNPATTYPAANLYRFETCNGLGENKFVPVKGTNYTVSVKIYSGDSLLFKSAAVSGFTCNMDPVDPAVELAEPAGTATLNLGAWFGKIENWGTPKRTYFIVGCKASEHNSTMQIRLKNGRYKMYVTVTDETDKTTKTVYYPFNKPGEEIDTANGFYRLALGEKGIAIDKTHAYTLEIKVYNLAGELKYAGKSGTGVFASTQEDFLANGPIDTSYYPTGDPESPLYEKSVLFVGDSITEAICEVNITETKAIAGWPGRIGVANNMYFVNKGLSGASVSDCRGSNTVLNQLKAMQNRTFDLVVMHGGANDAWDSTAVGKMTALDNFNETTFDQTTFAGGLEYMFWFAKTNYPNAVLGYIINFQLPGSSIGRLSDMSEYFNEAKKICDKWGIPYLDMYNNEELNARMKGTTRYAMGDYIHPNDRGYDILTPYVEQFCECIMKGGDPSKLTDPAPLPNIGNGITKDDVNLALGKPAKNGAGTTSSIVTDGSVSQYFMAGNWDAGDGKCYVEIDLTTLCNINKINVVNYVGNLLYQWEAYVTANNTLPIEQWTKVGGMTGTNMAYEDGNTIVFDTTSARYVRVYGIYDNASSAYVFNEISIYGEVDDSAPKSEVANGLTASTPSSDTDKLTDGNKTSDPAVIVPIEGGSVTVDLGAITKLSEIKVYTYSNNGAYQVYASADGNEWIYIGEKVANATGTVYDASFGCRAIFATTESYRYIKIQGIESARTDYCCALAEVEIYDENGGKLTPASATANRITYSANNSIDGNYTSYSFIQRPAGHTVIDLGDTYDIRTVIIYPAEVTDELTVQVSSDNKSWITIGTISAGATDAITCKTFGSYRYVRLAYTGANEYAIYEIEVFAVEEQPTPDPDPEPDTPVEPDEPDVPVEPDTPETPVAEELTAKDEVTITLGNGSTANNLKNGKTTSGYTLIAEGDKCYAVIDLQKAYTLTGITVYTYNGNYTFTVYGSNDGNTWTELAANEIAKDFVVANGYTLTLSGNYRYVKVVGTSYQSGYFTAYEMDVFGYEIIEEPEEPDTPAEEELTARDDVTITLGNGSTANGLKDGKNSGSYTLIAEGDKCYALIDLQKTYTVTKAVIYALNGQYLFEIYGSNDNSTWTKLAANEASYSYNAAEGFVMTLSGNYRYIKVVGTACQYGYFTTYEMDVFGYEAKETVSSDIKFEGHQLGNDGSSIRFIGSVSGLDYENVDLQITVIEGADKSYSYVTTKVFQVLNGIVNGQKQPVAATQSSGVTGNGVAVIDANYLFGYAITSIPAGTYTFEIVPVATLSDGTVIRGESATITVTLG